MLIQIILLLAIAVVAVLLGRSTTNARHMAFRRLFLLMFVVASALAILFPRALTFVAHALGVGRGTDLLLYAVVIAFIGSLAMNSRRAGELGHKITLLTRALALSEARLAEAEAARRAAAGENDEPGTDS